MVWPSLHNQLLYPLTFAFHKEGAPSAYIHFLLYSIAMLAVVAALAFLKQDGVRRLFANKTAIASAGAAGVAGIGLIIACDFSTVGSSVAVSVGIVLAAAFVPVHFTFWSTQLLYGSEKRVAFDLICSYLLFCLIVGLRIVTGLHSWPFALCFPAVSALLGWLAVDFPKKTYPLADTRFKDHLSKRMVPALLFVYMACISIWIMDPDYAVTDFPPVSRALMYAGVFAFGLILAVLYRPKSQFRTIANTLSTTLSVTILLCTILISGIATHYGADLGNFLVLAGKITLEMVIWLRMLVYAQAHHHGVVKSAAIYLTLVIGASNFLNVALLFSSQGFNVDRSSLPILAISGVSVVIILVVINVLLTVALAQAKSTGKETAEEAPCSAAINALISDDEVVARMREAFKLSSREVDTLRLAMRNMSAKDMAAELFVAESTVNSHLKSIYRKTDVHSKKELIKLVERHRNEVDAQSPIASEHLA